MAHNYSSTVRLNYPPLKCALNCSRVKLAVAFIFSAIGPTGPLSGQFHLMVSWWRYGSFHFVRWVVCCLRGASLICSPIGLNAENGRVTTRVSLVSRDQNKWRGTEGNVRVELKYWVIRARGWSYFPLSLHCSPFHCYMKWQNITAWICA